jgi:hypothetical protein
MKLSNPPKTLADGSIEAAHDVETVCFHCGYDLNKTELVANTCSGCGKQLEVQQNVVIQITTLPPMFGGVM